jgi:hypothetical protein
LKKFKFKLHQSHITERSITKESTHSLNQKETNAHLTPNPLAMVPLDVPGAKASLFHQTATLMLKLLVSHPVSSNAITKRKKLKRNQKQLLCHKEDHTHTLITTEDTAAAH